MAELENRYSSIYELKSSSVRGRTYLGHEPFRFREGRTGHDYVAAMELKPGNNFQLTTKSNIVTSANKEVDEAAFIIPKFAVKDHEHSAIWSETSQNRASQPLVVESRDLEKLIDLAHIIKQGSFKAKAHNMLSDQHVVPEQKVSVVEVRGLYVDAKYLGLMTILIFTVLIFANFTTDQLFIHPVVGVIGVLFGTSYFVMSIVDQKG